MITCYYNGKKYPPLPDWTKGYKYVIIRDAALEDPYVFATNSVTYKRNEINWMTHYLSASCWGYSATLENGKWGARRYDGSQILWADRSPNSANSTVWTNTDIYGITDINNIEGTKYLWKAGSEPLQLEILWTNGVGEKFSDISPLRLFKDWSVSGVLRCRCISGGQEVASFEWYKGGRLVSKQNRHKYADCRPSSDALGTYYYHCAVTFDSGSTFNTDNICVYVEEYTPNTALPDGAVGDENDGIIIQSVVTDIELRYYPGTTTPGGFSTFIVTVNGVGYYSKDFTVELSGHTSEMTHVVKGNNSFNVWIGEDETATSVLVTVKSLRDPTVTATGTVYIDHSTEGESTTTDAEKINNAFWKGFATAKTYFSCVECAVSVVNVATDEAEPSTEAGRLKRSFWKGFVSGVSVGVDAAMGDDIVASLEDGVLYIEKAPAKLNDGILEVDMNG